jgi:hypothetical protein
MFRYFYSAHQKASSFRLATVLGITLLSAVLFWEVGQQAAAQDAPTAGTANPGETIPPPEGTPMYLPLVAANSTPVPTPPPREYAKLTVQGGSLGSPAASSPDVNLSLRSYTSTNAFLGLVNYNGDTDSEAPQMAAMFTPARLPGFVAALQVYDWDWSCSPPTGCRSNPLTHPYTVTLLEMATTPGEPLSIASRARGIGSGFTAMVLYAEESRLTITYTRDDSPIYGYMVHFEDVAVAPELVALYRQLDAAGRKELPALRNGEVWGMAATGSIKVAVRDTGTFMDPRACKDWWVDYRSQCTMWMWRPLPASQHL